MTEKKDYFETICKVSSIFRTTLDRDELLDLIVESAIDTMEGKAACLFLTDEKKDVTLPVAQKGLSQNYLHAGRGSAAKTMSDVMKEGYLSIGNATTDSRAENHEAKKAEGIASILVVPVMVKGEIIGILALYTASPRDFSKDEIDFLRALAEQGGMAIENARLIEKIRENTKLFHNLATSINSTLDVKAIFHSLSEDMASALGVKAASVRLLDKDKKTLELVASYGLSEKYLAKGSVSAEKSIAEALKGKPAVVKDAATDKGVQYKDEKKEEGIESILCVPIKIKEEIIGVLRFYSGVPREFTEDEIMLVSALAGMGGMAIQNASMYLMLQDDMDSMKEDLWVHKSWF
ncbi:MAG: GAF domain-containing protein [Deltaproteobacteria bacterium]|nr:GAF domain-containing protein [Deltaproteobacteria bacterium]